MKKKKTERNYIPNVVVVEYMLKLERKKKKRISEFHRVSVALNGACRTKFYLLASLSSSSSYATRV